MVAGTVCPMQTTHAIPLLVTVPRAAQMLGVTPATAYSWIKAGDLPHLRLGGGLRVPTAHLAEMLGVSIETLVSTSGPRPTRGERLRLGEDR